MKVIDEPRMSHPPRMAPFKNRRTKMKTNNKNNLLKSYEFMACMQALLKMNIDNEITLSRLRQLFAVPTPRMAMRILEAQKLDYQQKDHKTGVPE